MGQESAETFAAVAAVVCPPALVGAEQRQGHAAGVAAQPPDDEQQVQQLGSLLAARPGITCSSCFHLKGRYRFEAVQTRPSTRPHYTLVTLPVNGYKPSSKNKRW